MDELQDQIRKAIDPVRAVYKTLLQNSALRNRLNRAGITDSRQREIERLMRSSDMSSGDAHEPYDVYTCIEALLEVARALAGEVGPSLKREISQQQSQMSSENRIALQMTLSNLDSNVRALVDRLSDLYIATSRLDEHRNGAARSVLRRQFPELAQSHTWQIEAS